MIKKDNIFIFAKSYIKYLHEVLNKIDLNFFLEIEKEFLDLRKNNKTLYVIGNGGGAATAQAMANDLSFDIAKKTKVLKPFKIISLVENSSTTTAIANDIGFENIFIEQLKIHFQKGDKVLIFSASGNSKNLIKAAKWIKKRSGKIIGILGFDGGKLLNLCNLVLHIKTNKGEYGPVEDVQLIFNHILSHWFQIKFKQ